MKFRKTLKTTLPLITVLVLAVILFDLLEEDTATPSKENTQSSDSTAYASLSDQSLFERMSDPKALPALEVALMTAIGPEEAAITIVEFGTYSCRVCRWVYQDGLLERLLTEYPNKIRYLYIPWPIFANDLLATESVYCAHEQGSFFWKYHNALYSLDYEDYLNYDHYEAFVTLAETLGLDKESFEVCLAESTYRNYVFDLIDEGRHLDLPGTPTFFVNDVAVSAMNLEEMVLAVLAD